MSKYRSRKKQNKSNKSTKSNSLNNLNLKGGVRLQTILENVGDSASVAFSFDLISHYFNDSLSVDAVLNPNDFIGTISLIKEKIGSGKSELRVFSLTDQNLRWETGFASKLQTLMGRQKGVIHYDEMDIIRPLNLVNGRYSFTVLRISLNPSVRSESYKLKQINDSREESYKIRKFYRTLKQKYNNYQKVDFDLGATPERSHSDQDIADATLLDTKDDDRDVSLVAVGDYPLAALSGGGGDAPDMGEAADHGDVRLADVGFTHIHRLDELVHVREPQVTYAERQSASGHVCVAGRVVERQGRLQEPDADLQ